ncbi:MAG: Ldh family oxidoreductase [Limnochordia bacterium]|nr:Ldh family oxidoreductase [Limnochordia bacterium]
MQDVILIDHKELEGFAFKIMQAAGCDEKRAKIVAKVLVESDLRGIASHGVARLGRYVNHIRQGLIDPKGEPVIVQDSPLAASMDGKAGVGQYVAELAMTEAIAKAEKNGIGFVSVRNSNHFGIAGYFAEQCVNQNMLGIALTNTGPYVVPTNGKSPVMGTNPLAISFPVVEGSPISIDMATSVVPLGKLETYARRQMDIPQGWAVDQTGHSVTDPSGVISDLKENSLGGILALGGEGEEFGGHKGFGLALMIELFTAGLAQGAPSSETYREVGDVCHFFGAIKLDLFGDPEAITRHFTYIVNGIRQSEKADRADRIYIHGEKEYEARGESLRTGIRLGKAIYAGLQSLAQEFDIELLGGN